MRRGHANLAVVLLDSLAERLVTQDGIVTRRQLVAAGARPHELQRWLRRHELVVVTPGVYVTHTGPLIWRQRVWAGVLDVAPAAVWGASALRWHEGRDGPADELVDLAVARHRHRGAPDGVRLHRRVRLDERVHWRRQPPIQRYDDAVVEVALATPTAGRPARGPGARGAGTDGRPLSACGGSSRRGLRHRSATGPCRVLGDLAAGTCSVLEHGYLELVEQRHGLPTARRQEPGRSSVGLVYRDAAYDGLLVELDGRLVHDTAKQRDADFERDLDAALDGRDTRRLTYGQVFDRPCATAGKLGRLLVVRGWQSRPTSCEPGCPAPLVFDRHQG